MNSIEKQVNEMPAVLAISNPPPLSQEITPVLATMHEKLAKLSSRAGHIILNNWYSA